jgi:hypothetical protein
MLEIGTGNGGSSQMWKHYFGPAAQIVTVDIREECLKFADEQVAVRIGSQADPMFIQSVIDEFGAPDIVLDDGSHVTEHVCATFEYLYPRMTRDAIYFIEDLHAAYWPDFGGGLRKSDTLIERIKHLIDEMHGHYIPDEIEVSKIGALTRSIQIYDSIVVLEKGPYVNKKDTFLPDVEVAVRW